MNPLNRLYEICNLESTETEVGWRRRKIALDQWISEYIEECSTSLRVINPNHFNTESMDYIKECLTKTLVEDLTTCTKYDIKSSVIDAKIVAVKLNKP